jgi:hypothetical protein
MIPSWMHVSLHGDITSDAQHQQHQAKSFPGYLPVPATLTPTGTITLLEGIVEVLH